MNSHVTTVKRGETIITSSPWVFVVSAQFRQRICEGCFEILPKSNVPPLKACHSCNLVVYCSSNCKSDGSTLHATECSVLKAFGSSRFFLDDKVRLILRTIFKLRDKKAKVEAEAINVEGDGELPRLRTFRDLMDHKKEIESDSANLLREYWLQAEMVLSGEYSNLMPNWDEFVSIYGKLLINCISLRTSRLDMSSAFGSGLYLAASIVDHSCEPNADLEFLGKTVAVKARRDIVAPEGRLLEAVRFSYIDDTACRKDRRETLRGIWYFDCDCDRCERQATED